MRRISQSAAGKNRLIAALPLAEREKLLLHCRPVVLANDVLQGDGDKATDTFGRMVVNTTVGVGGLIDVASKIGIPYHENDFGITMGKAGSAEGSYLVLPFAGPKPPRDLVGTVVDVALDPITYAQFHGSDTWK